MDGRKPDEAEYERRRRQYRSAALKQISMLLGSYLRSFRGKVLLWSCLFVVLMAVLIASDALAPGSAADWMAAGGAIFAAVVALSIATRDRRDRVAERDEADRAQMRLVRVDVTHYRDSSTPFYNFRVTLTNHGERPILGATVESASMHIRDESATEPAYTLSDPSPRPSVIEVVPHVAQQILINGLAQSDGFIITISDEDGRPWWPRAGVRPYVDVRVACSDSVGNHWVLSNNQGPHRHTSALGPPVLQRLWIHRRDAAQELWLYFGPSRATVRTLQRAAIVLTVALLISLVARNWLDLADVILPGLFR